MQRGRIFSDSLRFVLILSLSACSFQHCTKLSRSGKGPWPVERCGHAACCINYNQKRPKVLISGGHDNFFMGFSDLWILDVDAGRWWKVRSCSVAVLYTLGLRHTYQTPVVVG